VWTLLSTQSFFIAGIEDADKAQSSAFGATAMFLFTFVASLGGMWYDSTHKVEVVSNGDESEYHLSQGDSPPTYGTTA
jgi:hypothetical protein